MKPVHPKLIGATLGSLIAGLLTAEFERRLHFRLLPEEATAIQVTAGFAGGWLGR